MWDLAAEKRPDIRAERGGRPVFIEANAKQPRVLADTPDRLWYLVRDVVEEKRQKFADPRFHPGVIVADISPAKIEANETGLDGGQVAYPKYHVLLVRKEYRYHALLDLSRFVYLV